MLLMKGDCLERMKEIPDGSVDMVLCDPPYQTTKCAWDSEVDLDLMWEQLNRIIKPNGAVVLTSAQPFTTKLISSNYKGFRYDLIWEKTTATGHLNSKRMPMRAHEVITVFYNKLPTYNPQKTFGHERKVSSAQSKKNCVKTEVYGDHGLTSYDSTERYPRSVITTSTDKQWSKLHPTQKPVALMEYLIKTYTNEGETVLDFTFGSNTTGVACANTNRGYIGIELDETYFDVGLNRLKEVYKGEITVK